MNKIIKIGSFITAILLGLSVHSGAQTVNYINTGLDVDVAVSQACDGLENASLTFTANSASGGSAVLLAINGPAPIGFQAVGQPLVVGVPFVFDNGGVMPAGTYDFIIDDGGGIAINTFTATYPSVTISALNTITVSVDNQTDNTSCITPNGEITVTLGEGSGSFSYTWAGPNGYSSTGTNTAGTPITINGLEGGTYSLTVDDDFSICGATQDVVLADPTVTIAVDNTTDNTRCVGPFDGSIAITASGAGGAYTYSWSGPNGYTSSDEDISNLEAGNYTITVTDIASGCSNSQLVPVGSNTPIIGATIDANNDNTKCANFDGSLEITPTGGTAYTYAWTGPNGFVSTSEDISGLEPGTYSVTITDTPTGCEYTTNITVADSSPALTIDVDANNGNTNCTIPDGAISITPNNGTGYTYSWTGPNGFTSTNEDITGLESGSYTVIVTDVASECTATTTVAVADNTPTIIVTLDGSTGNTSCTTPNGTINITATGGTGYSYAWTGPGGFVSTDEDLTGLEAGSYDVVVTDVASTCTETLNVVVADNRPVITVTVDTQTDNTSCSAPNGTISITAGGGTGYTYSWTGPSGYTSTDQNLTNLESGDYTVIVTDTNSGCTGTETVTIADATPVLGITLDQNVPNTSCVTPNGELSITMTGGTSYTYSWTGPGGFVSNSEDLTALLEGTYDVTVTEVTSGCTISDTYTVLLNTPTLGITEDAVVDNTSCSSPNGSISITPTGGTSYTFSWTGPGGFTSTDEDLLNLASGTYDVTVTEVASGCTTTGSYTVNDNLPNLILSADGITDNTNCSPANGEILVSVTGGTTYTYSWSGPGGFTSTDEDISALIGGDYTVIVTETISGCTVTDTYTVTDNLPTITVNIDGFTDNTNCVGPNGTIDITAGGGTIYTYAWTGPNGFTSTDEDLTGLEAGVYDVTITDTNSGCTVTASQTIADVLPTIIINVDSTTPNNNCITPNGAASITVTGAGPAYTFDWSVGGATVSTNEDPTGLLQGDYTLTVTDDATGCFVTTLITIGDNTNGPVVTLDVNTPNTSCVAFNGALDISITGGSGDLTISWTGPNGFSSNTEDLSGLEPGNYDLTVTDNISGCVTNETYVLADNLPTITVTEVITDVNDCATPDGAIDITVSGGTGYDFAWTGPNGFTSTDEDLLGLEAGVYDVTITDTNSGCFITASYTVNDNTTPLGITLDASVDNTSCTAPNGSIDITTTGGTAYTYSWTGPNGFVSSLEDISGLEAGDYTVVATETTSGCTGTTTVTIGETLPTLVIATDLVTDNTDCANPNGAISVTVTGSADLSYSWTSASGGFTSNLEDITGLIGDDYTLIVTDNLSGCTATETITVVENASPLIVNGVVTDNTNCVGPNGSIDITVTGGSGAETVNWTGPNGYTSTAQDINNLAAGTYTVTVTEAGCTTVESFVVSDNLPVITITVDNVIDNADCISPNGAIEITVTGVTSPDFSWSGASGYSSTSEDIIGLVGDIYTVTVTDPATGCSATEVVTVQELASPVTINAVITDNTFCVNPNGSVDVTLTGNSGGETYTWTGPNGFTASTEDVNNLEAGSYTLSVNDGGCITNRTFIINNNVPVISVSVDVVVDNTDCANPNGSIDITAAGSADLSYSWTSAGGFTSNLEDISGLIGDDYTVVVTDNISGCFTTTTVNVQELASPLSATATITDNTNCVVSNGSITLNVAGAGGTETYDWVGPNGFTANTRDITDLESGDYTVTIIESGCSTVETFTVNDNLPVITINVDAVVDNTDCTVPNGEISVTASGAASFTYAWTSTGGFSSTDEDITGLSPDVYTLTATDPISGCTASIDVDVIDNSSPIVVTETIVDNTGCLTANGAITLNVGGVTGSEVYSWTGPGGFTSNLRDITGLSAGDYTVVVFENGCTTSSTYTVSDIVTSLSVIVDNVVDNTDCLAPNGAIDITVIGGTNLSFAWVGNGGFTSSDEDLTALIGDTYTVIITDLDSGCEITETVDVQELASPIGAGAVIFENTSCNTPNGQIQLTATGVAGAETYSWTGPGGFTASTADISGLAPGDYTLTISEAGCTTILTYTVGDNPTVLLVATDLVTDNTACSAPFDGAIEVTASNGDGNYTFAWTGPNGFTSTDEDPVGLENGDYTVIVTDGNGCTGTADIQVGDATPGPQVTVDLITDNTSCNLPYTGAVDITITGGSTYSFQWVGPNGYVSTAEDIANIEAGDYVLTVTDDVNGCSSTQTIAVGGPANCGVITCSGFSFSFNNVLPTCGSDNGVIVFESPTLNGVPLTNYQVTLLRIGDNVPRIEPNPINGVISGLQSGDYQYELLDFVSGNTCTGTLPLPFETTVTAFARDFVDSPCFGLPQGSAVIDATGSSTGQYYYSADNGSTWTLFTPGNVVSGLMPNGTYNILVGEEENEDCPAIVEVTINNASTEITLDYTASPATCANNDGSIFVTGVGGGGGGHSFNLDGVDYAILPDGGVFAGLDGGSHLMIVTDINGCFSEFDITVPFPGLVDFTTLVNDPDCSSNQADNGSIITAINEIGTFTVGISTSQSEPPAETFNVTSDGTSTFTFNGLTQGVYYVSVSSVGASCPDVEEVVISGGPAAITFDAELACNGNSQIIVLNNITGEAGTPLSIDVFRIGTTNPETTINLPSIPVGNTFTIDSEPFLDVSFEYAIQISQDQVACGTTILSDLETVQVAEPLVGAVLSTSTSYTDTPNGEVSIGNINGGLAPYRISLSLVAPFIPSQTFETPFEDVPLNSNLDFEISYSLLPAGRYEATLVDALGCETVIEFDIVPNTDLFIPNLITPNGDGANDVFFIRNLPPNSELVISNRWGRQVFMSSDYQNDWDAEDVEDGVYFYIIKSADEIKRGWLEIQRGVPPK